MLRPCYTFAVSVVLSLFLFVLAGCSDSDLDQDGQGGEKVNATNGLMRSELIALKKANKNPVDRQKALLNHEIERLQAKGVILETKTSAGKTKKNR
jgi:hypothetical protein